MREGRHDKDPLRCSPWSADKDMPYELLYSVLGTAGQSGLVLQVLVVGASN